MRICRSQTLRQRITHASEFHNGPYSTTGNQTRTLGSWLEENFTGTMPADHLVRNRTFSQRNPNKRLFRLLHTLADRLRYFVGFSQAVPDMSGAISGNNDCAEAKAPASLDDFTDATDMNDSLFKVEPFGTYTFYKRSHTRHSLELQTGLACGLS
jgi:hypothetical protein